jgi:hypothetical protein
MQSSANFVVGLPPYDGGVFPTYIDGVRGILDRDLSQSAGGIRAAAGDAEATRRIANELSILHGAMQHALDNRNLIACWPDAVRSIRMATR